MIIWLAGTAQGILVLGLGWALAQWLDNRVFGNNRIVYRWEGDGKPPQLPR